MDFARDNRPKEKRDGNALEGSRQYETLELEISDLQRKIESLRTKNAELNSQNSNMARIINSIDSFKKNSGTMMIEDTVASFHNQEKNSLIQNLQSSLQIMSEQVNESQKERKKIEQNALTQIEEMFRLEVEFNRLKAELQKFENLRVENESTINKKNIQIEELQQKLQNATTATEASEVGYLEASAKIKILNTEIKALKENQMQWQLNAAELSTTVQILQEKIEAGQFRETQLQQTIDQEITAKLDLQEMLNEKERHLIFVEATFHNDKKNLETELQDVELRFKDLSGQLQAQIEVNRIQLAEYHENIFSLDGKFQEENLKNVKISEQHNAQLAIFLEKINLLNNEKNQLEEALAVVQAENQILSQKVNSFEANVAQIIESKNDTIKKNETEKLDLERHIECLLGEKKDLESHIYQLICDQKNRDDLLGGMARRTDNLASENADLLKQVKELTSEKVALTEKLESVNESTQAALQKELRTAEQCKNKLAEVEKRFEQYYSYVNAEKNRQQSALESLARQVQYATTINPLKDYLAVTEKELSRVECELKKMPSISAQRGQMEVMIDQLFQQREFLKELINQSEKSLAQQGLALERLSKSGLLVPPPLLDSKN